MEPSQPVSPKPKSNAIVWLLGPFYLLVALAAVVLVVKGPTEIFVVALAVIFGGCFLWLALTTFLPSKADRKCTQCGQVALERLDADSTEGLVCTHCGWSDATASSFYLTEEEGGLDEIVLRQRAEQKRESVR